MTIRGAITTIVSCTLILGGIGATVGSFLGFFVPGYYRSVFHVSREAEFDTVSIGIGQGLTQGIAGGVVVGVALVAILCWRETRLAQINGPQGDPNSVAGSQAVTRRLFKITGILLGLGFCTSFWIILGIMIGELRSYHRRYLEEQAALVPIVSSDSAFSRVKITENSAGGASIYGSVSTESDLARLRVRVEKALFAKRAKWAFGVSVDP